MKTFSCFITFLFVNICICFGQKSKDEVIFNKTLIPQHFDLTLFISS